MAIQYLAKDERWSATPGVFTWRGVKAQPLLYRRRLNLHCWRGVPASHIRDGLHMVHLEPRNTARKSHERRMRRYAQHLAAATTLGLQVRTVSLMRQQIIRTTNSAPAPF